MMANQLFYKVLNERTIIVAADTTQKRRNVEEQVIRTFFVSHADATELSQLLTTIVRVAGMAIQPTIVAEQDREHDHRARDGSVVQIIERVIEANDKPRAEVMVDVQILEVNRERAKQYGLNLGDYSIGWRLLARGGAGTASGQRGAGPFNLNTISQGVSTADFYLAVPTAVVRFLESDSQTKVLAKPQLRGAEGQKLSLNLGEDVPVPSTTFTPLAGGGAATSPLTSFGYRTVGIIVEMTPRVTYDGEIILELTVENSARGQDTNIAGQNLPSFLSRKVQTKLRLRDGESNLLAGLLREDERKSLTGFPGVLRLPIVRSCSRTTTARSADRHRDAADAAHRADARADGGGPEPDLHRHAEQHGAERSAAAHGGAGARAAATAGRRPARATRRRRRRRAVHASQPPAAPPIAHRRTQCRSPAGQLADSRHHRADAARRRHRAAAPRSRARRPPRLRRRPAPPPPRPPPAAGIPGGAAHPPPAAPRRRRPRRGSR